MKVRDSGMPNEELWEQLFDVGLVLDRLGIDASLADVAELGCGHGTFTIPVARRISGTLHTYDIDEAMVARTRERAADAGLANVVAEKPDASWVGIALAAVTAPTMPLLAMAKRRVGLKLGSAATVHEAEENQICAYLSIALLMGLLLNALFGIWWADPLAALVIAAVAVNEGVESWRGEEYGD